MSKARKKTQGHPAGKDPVIAKTYRTMRAMVELTRDLKDHPDVPEEHFLWLRAGALSAMLVYSDITGLPSPMDHIEMDAAHAEYKKRLEADRQRCPICKDDVNNIDGFKCEACGVNYAKV